MWPTAISIVLLLPFLRLVIRRIIMCVAERPRKRRGSRKTAADDEFTTRFGWPFIALRRHPSTHTAALPGGHSWHSDYCRRSVDDDKEQCGSGKTAAVATVCPSTKCCCVMRDSYAVGLSLFRSVARFLYRKLPIIVRYCAILSWWRRYFVTFRWSRLNMFIRPTQPINERTGHSRWPMWLYKDQWPDILIFVLIYHSTTFSLAYVYKHLSYSHL